MGVRKEVQKAVECFEKLAENKDIESLRNLAFVYKRFFDFYIFLIFLFFLFFLYFYFSFSFFFNFIFIFIFRGIGEVNKNTEKFLHYLHILEDMNDVVGLRQLAYFYKKNKNVKKSINYFKRLAELGK